MADRDGHLKEESERMVQTTQGLGRPPCRFPCAWLRAPASAAEDSALPVLLAAEPRQPARWSVRQSARSRFKQVQPQPLDSASVNGSEPPPRPLAELPESLPACERPDAGCSMCFARSCCLSRQLRSSAIRTHAVFVPRAGTDTSCVCTRAQAGRASELLARLDGVSACMGIECLDAGRWCGALTSNPAPAMIPAISSQDSPSELPPAERLAPP